MTMKIQTAQRHLPATLLAATCALLLSPDPALALGDGPGSGPTPSPVSCARLEAVDGDNVRCDGLNVRLVGWGLPGRGGFDAAETSTGGHAECLEEGLIGDRATQRMRQLLRGDVELHLFEERDRYGRGLGRLMLADGRTAGDVMLEEGYAREWPDGPEWWCE